MLATRVIDRAEQGEDQTTQEVFVVFFHRGKLGGLLKPPIRDVRTLRVDAGDLIEPTLLLSFVRDSERQVRAA
jgi:hypothetical protein